MVTGTWTLRYALARLACLAADARAATAAGAALLPALVAAAPRRVTAPLWLAGAAMAPALNARGATDPAAVEGLLLWRAPGGFAPRVGDVVAFTAPARHEGEAGVASSAAAAAPLPLEAQGGVLVRRVAAVPGDALACDDPAAPDLPVPPGHVWVTADNAALPPATARDSRSFGFVATSALLGRVIYAAASATDHAPVAGLPPETAAAAADVLEAELDVEALLR